MLELVQRLINDPISRLELGVAIIYASLSVATWRKWHRVHPWGYLAVSMLAGAIAACSVMNVR